MATPWHPQHIVVITNNAATSTTPGLSPAPTHITGLTWMEDTLPLLLTASSVSRVGYLPQPHGAVIGRWHRAHLRCLRDGWRHMCVARWHCKKAGTASATSHLRSTLSAIFKYTRRSLHCARASPNVLVSWLQVRPVTPAPTTACQRLVTPFSCRRPEFGLLRLPW